MGVASARETTAVARGELVGVGEASAGMDGGLSVAVGCTLMPGGRTGDWPGPGVDATGDAVGVGVVISRAKLRRSVMAKIERPGDRA